MVSEFEQNLEKYVEVILKVGLNLQQGQRLLIGTGGMSTPLLELAPFVELITKRAYQMGAKFVEVIWNDPQLDLIRFQYAPRDSFEVYSTWKSDAFLDFAEKGDAILFLYADIPDFFAGQDPALMAIGRKAHAEHFKTFLDLLSKNAMNWVKITPPVEAWAEKIFPDLSPDLRKTKMWNTIFDICRLRQKDPISAWNDHIKQLHTRTNHLNHKKYSTLKLKAPGTDLMIGLPKGHIWQSANITTQRGISNILNIPTEEIFTLPQNDKTEGVVTATKPLPVEVVIDDFSLTFSKGRVVEITAKKGEKTLKKLLEMDEGMSRLGEIALVPHSSPISQSGILFYNRTIDENASCHVALGMGYRFCMENGDKMSDEEFMTAGGNVSLGHIDFMIGSGEMDIDGITEDGTSEPIMRKGEWAFKI